MCVCVCVVLWLDVWIGSGLWFMGLDGALNLFLTRAVFSFVFFFSGSLFEVVYVKSPLLESLEFCIEIPWRLSSPFRRLTSLNPRFDVLLHISNAFSL